jgi:hypothetical protein
MVGLLGLEHGCAARYGPTECAAPAIRGPWGKNDRHNCSCHNCGKPGYIARFGRSRPTSLIKQPVLRGHIAKAEPSDRSDRLWYATIATSLDTLLASVPRSAPTCNKQVAKRCGAPITRLISSHNTVDDKAFQFHEHSLSSEPLPPRSAQTAARLHLEQSIRVPNLPWLSAPRAMGCSS